MCPDSRCVLGLVINDDADDGGATKVVVADSLPTQVRAEDSRVFSIVIRLDRLVGRRNAGCCRWFFAETGPASGNLLLVLKVDFRFQENLGGEAQNCRGDRERRKKKKTAAHRYVQLASPVR